MAGQGIAGVNPAELQHLDRNIALPLYQQIKRNIRTRIRAGRWQPGTRLPSENELVNGLGVSRMTVHRALRELTQEGLLERVHGLGTFVAKPPRHASLITLQDIADEIRLAGFTYGCEVLELGTVTADAQRARLMEMEPGGRLFRLLAVHFQDRDPIQIEDRMVSPALVPEFIRQDFSRHSATQYLVGLIKPDEMEHVVQAVLPDRWTARTLNMDPAEPCLQLNRRTWKDGRVVTGVRLTYPGYRYALAARYQTDQYTIR